jgi:hypothetical protein
LLSAVLSSAAGAGLLQRCCLLLGLAAEATGCADAAAVQQELECSLIALRGVLQQQLEQQSSSSSNGVAAAAVWGMTKVAGQLLQCSSSSSMSAQQQLFCTTLPVATQVLSCAVDSNAVDSQQQQRQQWLAAECLACCSVLALAVWPGSPTAAAEAAAAAAAAEEAKVQLLDALAAVSKWAEPRTTSSSNSDAGAALQVSDCKQTSRSGRCRHSWVEVGGAATLECKACSR